MSRFYSHIAFGICLALLTSCYRESTVEEFTVTVTRVTDENAESLASGKVAHAQLGDYLLQNTRFQAVFNGLGEVGNRHLFLPKAAGALLDLNTHIRNTTSQGFTSREDDGILALTQGINMNRNAVVSYDRIRINQISNIHAQLIMTGYIYDTDGSLQSSGFQVNASTHQVNGVELTTTYDVEELDSASDIYNFAINRLTVTTVVSNLTNQELPLFTVNDILVTKSRGAAPFIPYPGWGFEIPTQANPKYAYASFVQIMPNQPNTAHYAALSNLDGMLLAGRVHDEAEGLDYTMIGKPTLESRTLPAQEQLTFSREFYALNQNTSNNLESSFSSPNMFSFMASRIRAATAPSNLFNQLGTVEFLVNTKSGFGLRTSVEYIEESVSYFNGANYVKLEPGRTFPIFGDLGVASSYFLAIPYGQIGVRFQVANTTENFVSRYTKIRAYPDGTIEENQAPMIVGDDILLTGILNASNVTNASASFTFINPDKRILYGRAKLEPIAGTAPVTFGNRPVVNQGPFAHYLFNESSGFISMPEGQYQLIGSHGPLYNLNFQDITVAMTDADTTNTDTTDLVLTASPAAFVFNMGKAVDWDGYFSADFDVRSSADNTGVADYFLLLRLAYAQDLDVFFTTDLFHQPRTLTPYNFTALNIAGLDSTDRSDNVLSLYDEVANARATAVVGRTNDSYPDRGRFSILNLPDEKDQIYLEIPKFESDPASFYDVIRQKYPSALIQVNRPRAPKSKDTGLFTAIAALSGTTAQTPIAAENPYLNRTADTGSHTKWMDFDLFQILANNYYNEFLLSRSDWFNMLNAGVYRPITGGTSGGEIDKIAIGSVRTYAKVAETKLRDNDLSEFWTAVKNGNSFVTNGPLIEAKMGQASFGDNVSLSSASVLELTVKAAPWIPVKEIRLIIDGVSQVVPMVATSDETVRFQGSVPLNLGPGSHWIVVEAGATLTELANGSGESGSFGRINPGHLPLAISNPIFVR